MRPLRYSHLGSCGHTAFTGPPLAEALEVVGAPVVDLWVASSDTDADVFAYLEDVNPTTGKARCVWKFTHPSVIRFVRNLAERKEMHAFDKLLYLQHQGCMWRMCKCMHRGGVQWQA